MPTEQITRTLNVLLNVEPHFAPKAKWVLQTFCAQIGCRARFHERYASDRVQIYYGPRTETPYPVKIRHNPEAAAFFKGNEDYPANRLRFFRCGADLLPFLFSPPGDVFHLHGKQILVHKDIVSSAFYFLSCWQEHTGKPDKDGRQAYAHSLQARWDIAHVPVVDRYASLLRQAIAIALPQVMLDTRWPNGASMAVSLSHDLDYWNYWTSAELASVNRYNLRRLFRSPLHALYKLLGHQLDKRLFYHPARRNSAVIQHEQHMGLHSTTFVLSNPELEDRRQVYLVDQGTELKDFLTIINDRMVQLHGSGEASGKMEALREQMMNLLQAGYQCQGYRAHQLQFSYDETLPLLEEAHLDYDASLGWWEHTGFRAGTSMPFYPFWHKENRPLTVLEIPLSVMDVTLFSPRAMKLSADSAQSMLRRLMNNAATNGGHLSLLWHYRTFDPIDFPRWRSMYWKLLRQAQQRQAWVCSLDELYTHWKKKYSIKEPT